MNAKEVEQKYGALPVEIKKEIICISPSLEKTNRGLRPPVCDENEEFYFVSYSHKDYREVYQDIYDLQELGVKIFYDRGGLIEGTKDWRAVAKNYISRNNCIGVVFYISENSILSESIHEEIKRTIELNKPIVCINMPVKRKLKDGRVIEDEIVSADTLLEILSVNGFEIDDDKKDYFSEYFNEHVLYAKITETPAEKKQWLEKMPKPTLFHFSKVNTFMWCEIKKAVQLSTVYDITIDAVGEKDYLRNDFKDSEWVLKSIGTCAFSNHSNLMSVYLPDDVEMIEPYAFYNCQSLKTIDLTNVRYIQDSAFSNCVSLKQLNVPKKCSRIGKNAFDRCISLEKIKISSSADELCEEVFHCCDKLKKVDLAESSIKIIGERAFVSCISLKTVSLPDSLKVIGKFAFANCKSLTTIKLPKNLEKIGDSAFGWCAFISFKLPENVTSIGEYVFAYCTKLQEITIPGSIRIISNSAFKDCKALKRVVIEQGVEKIEYGAFWGCRSIEEISLPNSIKSIRGRAFDGCLKLKKLYFEGTLDEWNNVERSINWAIRSGDFMILCSDGAKLQKR